MGRPFPWKCRTCGKVAVHEAVTDYATEMEHDGRAYSLNIPSLTVLECKNCLARVLPDEALGKVTDALRTKVGLLSPEAIREKRKLLGLNQEQLANHLNVAKETVSRWETGGQIQQRAMDLLLRLFFGVPEVRSFLGLQATQSAK
jgi:putative zinc finger/helix-turn-helix YgiT family protein